MESFICRNSSKRSNTRRIIFLVFGYEAAADLDLVYNDNFVKRRMEKESTFKPAFMYILFRKHKVPFFLFSNFCNKQQLY